VFKKSEKMPWYKGLSLIETLDKMVKPLPSPVNKPLRACVQDVYDIEGKKIVVCKVLTGTLEVGKTVAFDPSGEEGLVKKIEMFGKEIETAGPGESVGIIANSLKEAKRGEVISYPKNRAKTVKSFVAEMILFPEIEVKINDILMVRSGTAENKCKVQKILERINPVNLTVDAEFPEILKGGDVGKILFSSLESMCIEKFSDFPELGRFVIEGGKGTVAAGIVLETKDMKAN
jgi:elongation factor 1-alpha